MEEEKIHFIDVAGQSYVNDDRDTGQSKSQDQHKSSTGRKKTRNVSIVPQTVEETLNDLVKEVAAAGRKKKWITIWSPLIISIFGGGLLTSSFELIMALIDKNYYGVIIWLISFVICIGLVICFVFKYREDIKDEENHIGIIKHCVQRIVCNSNGYYISRYYYHDKSDDMNFERIYEKCVKGHERLQDNLSPKFPIALLCLLLPSSLIAQNASQLGCSFSADRVGLILSVFSSSLALLLFIKMRKDEKEKRIILRHYEELIRKYNTFNKKISHRELYEQGKELFKTGNNSLAIEKFTEAIALSPKQYMYYEYRADALDKMGDTDKALNDYQMALKLTNNGDNIRIIHKIAIIQNDLGNVIEAGLYYEKAYKILQRNSGINSRSTDTAEIINFLNDYGNFLVQLNKLSEADEVFSRATETCNTIKEANDDCQALIAMTLINSSILHKNMLRLEDAEKESYGALQKYRQLAQNKPDKHLPDVALALNNLGNIYQSTNRSLDAIKAYEESISILHQLLATNPEDFMLDMALTLSNLANLYFDQYQYEDALKEYREALEIRKKVLGEEHPDTAMSYNNIGNAYSCLGDYNKALEYHEMALAIRQKVLGKEHPDTAMSYGNIGLVYSDLGNYKKALECQEKALEIRKSVLGEEHTDTAMSYNSIGVLYGRLGDYKKALENLEKSVAIKQKVLGEEHPDTAKSYGNIGNVYGGLGDHKKALEYHKKVLAIMKKVFGEEHPDTAKSYGNIGNAYFDLGDYKKALEFYEKSLAIRKRVLGEEHTDTAYSYGSIGNVYSCLGDYNKALEYHEKDLAIGKMLLGEEHPETATSYNNIGLDYFLKHEYPKALEYLEKALKIREAKLGEKHPLTQKTKMAIEMTNSAMDNEK